MLLLVLTTCPTGLTLDPGSPLGRLCLLAPMLPALSPSRPSGPLLGDRTPITQCPWPHLPPTPSRFAPSHPTVNPHKLVEGSHSRAPTARWKDLGAWEPGGSSPVSPSRAQELPRPGCPHDLVSPGAPGRDVHAAADADTVPLWASQGHRPPTSGFMP